MTGEERFNLLQKPGKKVTTPKPLKQAGKVAKQRQADRIAKLKAEPADHAGLRVCYIRLKLTAEHVIDGSVRPDLRHNKANQRWADGDCNSRKKIGTLTAAEKARVKKATVEVLKAVTK